MSIENLRLWSGKDITEFPNYDKEVNIPFFVNESHREIQQKQWHRNYEDARIGAAVGSVKKENRQAKREERRRKHSNIEFAILAAIVTLVMLLVGAVETGTLLFL